MVGETIFGKARMDVFSDLRRVWDQKYAGKKSILNFTCHKFSFVILHAPAKSPGTTLDYVDQEKKRIKRMYFNKTFKTLDMKASLFTTN